MPIYNYTCTECGKQFKVKHEMGAKAEVCTQVNPECEKEAFLADSRELQYMLKVQQDVSKREEDIKREDPEVLAQRVERQIEEARNKLEGEKEELRRKNMKSVKDLEDKFK